MLIEGFNYRGLAEVQRDAWEAAAKTCNVGFGGEMSVLGWLKVPSLVDLHPHSVCRWLRGDFT